MTRLRDQLNADVAEVAVHGADGLSRRWRSGGPTDQARSRVKVGEVVLAIDGQAVDPSMDLPRVLNGPLDRDVVLKVRSDDGAEREVVVRPTAQR